ncbi:MAG: hypothetical protein ACE14M_08540 [Terriglobales bacterium]
MALFRERINTVECARQLNLVAYTPSLTLEGVLPGVDNVRHDVFLSPKLAQQTRSHIARLIAKYGNVEDLVVESRTASFDRPPSIVRPQAKPQRAEAADFKSLVVELQTASLNCTKAENNLSLDLLWRLALIKFLRLELGAQFANMLERCRAKLRSYEGPRQANQPRTIELSERVAAFQVAKKIVLRKVGQELFDTLREVEKETIARMRRSLFGETPDYDLFLNRLLFTEDGRDDFVNAEHYVLLGNYERDPDRFQAMLEITRAFLKWLGFGAGEEEDNAAVDAFLSAPENAHELVAGGIPDESTPKGKIQKAVLAAWVDMLERENVMEHVIASYEAPPLLPEYTPAINPQQLKNALISRAERKRVENLLEEHGKLSPNSLHAAVRRVAQCRGADRAKLAGRFLRDFMRYHRDLRRLETVIAALDTVNLISNEKVRELSAINHTLYELLLPEEQKPVEEKVAHHVIVKADIRDSTLLICTLYDRGLNPASYFSLNFYDPINKLLSKYNAQKLFIEGDALILALFEHEGEHGFAVGRACVLAKEILAIVRGYNDLLSKSGLPALELGIGISFQDTAPMYLMDGKSPIMISPALNASDRLSSCSKSARKLFAGVESLFNVFLFQTVDDADTAGQPDEFVIRYNIGGICLDEAGFRKLQQEISLQRYDLPLPALWDDGPVRLFNAVVPVAPGIFHKLVVREARIPHIDAREFQLKEWTDRRYYEVCTNPAIYEYVEEASKQRADTTTAVAQTTS